MLDLLVHNATLPAGRAHMPLAVLHQLGQPSTTALMPGTGQGT